MSRGDAIASAVLVVALATGFAGLVAEPRSLIVDGDRPWVDPNDRPGARPIGNDLTGLFLPRHLWTSAAIREQGHPPLWDPRGFAGRPNSGNPQAGLWYPPRWLAWAWGSPSAMGWLTVGHLLGAGFGAFALGRVCGLGHWGSTVAGVSLMLNPYLIAQTHEGHLPHVWASCWYPWAFAGAIVLRRGRRLGRLLLPISLAMALLAGHPQEGAYLAVALACWALADVIAAAWGADGRWSVSAGVAGRWAVAFALAAGLSAVEWLPDLRARPYVAGPLGGEGGGGSGPYHLHGSDLLRLISPRALGGPADSIGLGSAWETMIATGWGVAVLSGVGIARHPDRRMVRGWVALLALSVAHAFGGGLGVASAVAALPGLGGLRVPSRSLFLAASATAVLAGMGASAIGRREDARSTLRMARRFAAMIGAIALAVLVGAFARWLGADGRWPRGCARIIVDGLVIGMAVAVIITLYWRAGRPDRAGAAAILIGTAAIVELAISAGLALPVSPPERFLAPDGLSEAIAAVRPPGAFRVRAVEPFGSDLGAWRDDLEMTNLNDLFQLRHAAMLYRPLYPIFRPSRPGLDPPRAHSALDRLGVALVIAERPPLLPIGPIAARGARDGVPFAVYANRDAMPRAHVLSYAAVVAEAADSVQFWSIDPRVAVLMPFDPLPTAPGPRQPFMTAAYEPRGTDRVVVRVTTEAPGLLVVADTWMPGWSSTVDGRPSPVLRGDIAFRVIPLPRPGRHEVVMTYRAPGLALGAAITATALLVLLVAVIVPCRGPVGDGSGVNATAVAVARPR